MAQHSSFYRPRPGVDTSGLPEPLALRRLQAAAAINVSPSTLDRLVSAGEIAVKKAGRCSLYDLAELKAYLARNRAGGQA